jgi:hypothetical protein
MSRERVFQINGGTEYTGPMPRAAVQNWECRGPMKRLLSRIRGQLSSQAVPVTSLCIAERSIGTDLLFLESQDS